jgi:hypothetical protein
MEAIFGPTPVYDAENDKMAHPDESEHKDLSLHVRMCAKRYTTVMVEVTKTRASLHSTQRLLIVIIVLLAINGALDFKTLLDFGTP